MLAIPLLVCLLLAVFVKGAEAKIILTHEGSLDPSAAPVKKWEEGPRDVEVNQATGNVYAIQPNQDAIVVFNAGGQYVSQINSAGSLSALTIDNSGGANAGAIYVGDRNNDVIYIYGPAGALIGQLDGSTTLDGGFADPAGLAVDTAGTLYVADHDSEVVTVSKYVPSGGTLDDSDYDTEFVLSESKTPTKIDIDTAGNIYAAGGFFWNLYRYSPTGAFLGIVTTERAFAMDVAVDRSRNEYALADWYWLALLTPDGFTRAEVLFGQPQGIAVHEATGRLYVSSPPYSLDYFKRRSLADPVTGASSGITDTAASVVGSVDRDEGGPITECYFEYGSDVSYGKVAPCKEATPLSDQETAVTADLTGLLPGITYHYRLAAENVDGKNVGEDMSFKTFRAPSIEGFSTSKVLATSAVLHAQINPQDKVTTYYFEYGPTPEYGQRVPIPDGEIPAGTDPVSVSHPISGLQEGVTYHFRVTASNEYGTAVSGNQTFDFFPPRCPNASIRQQTGANYLPDCRAYEIVSPEDANGISWFPAGGPVSGTAVSPSRAAFTGNFSSMPGIGEPIVSEGDLYVATRTDAGWKTSFVGLPGNKTLLSGGPPPAPEGGDKLQAGVLTNNAMTRFVQWDNGVNVFFADGNEDHPPTNAAYLYDEKGGSHGRLPTTYDAAPGAKAATDCPKEVCPGAVAASKNLDHYVFSSQGHAYLPDGESDPPGSAYDNDIAADTVMIASRLPGGEPIPQEASIANEHIKFPGVSEDGSRILMSTAHAGGGVHLYMREDGAISYDVTEEHSATFAGMTADGSKVYFVTAGKVTADDTDTSADLYMWEPVSGSYTRISAGDGTGNSDSCTPTNGWSQQCGVGVILFQGWAQQQSGEGGNGRSDNTVAAESGDVYFYSPEQLDGDRGLPNQRNLYVYRDGRAHHVAVLPDAGHCVNREIWGDTICADGPVLRIQVSPDGDHMALLTHGRLTTYDNQGFVEMYTYEPDTREMLCISCIPSGQVPTGDVHASQNGLFMTDDGRAFFYTKDALVPNDTNRLVDVYEYVDGRARLITPGTGDQNVDEGGFGINILQARPGLVSVSADGTDVYFSTYDKLVGQDRNGSILKLYVARTGGGFPYEPPPPACTAADECHGPASNAPKPPEIGSAADLGDGGNVIKKKSKKKNAKKTRKGKKRAARAKRAARCASKERSGKRCRSAATRKGGRR